MKKILPIAIVLIIVSAILIPYSYSGNENSSFFTVSKKEVSSGEVIEMTINLKKVDYNSSKFTLVSEFNADDVFENEENVELQKEDDDIIITINKEELNLDKITLYYTIPEDTEEGTVFTIVATIRNAENEEETLTSVINVSVTKKSNNETDNKDNQNDKNSKTDNNKELNENKDDRNQAGSYNQNGGEAPNQSMQRQGSNDNKEMSENSNEESNSSMSKSSGGMSSGTMTGNAETVRYNGSDNNYLSNLSIEGYSLNKEFNKESSTYFVKVGSDVTALNVIVTAEDENAVVCISGADSIKSGTNKVLISVTSESGEVRTYRIYVTQS